MSLDINVVFEERVFNPKTKEFVWEYNNDILFNVTTNDVLMSWLGVFGSTNSSSNITPISKERGLPDDFSIYKNENDLVNIHPERPITLCDMGNFGFSWLLSSEILIAAKNLTPVEAWKFVSVDDYRKGNIGITYSVKETSIINKETRVVKIYYTLPVADILGEFIEFIDGLHQKYGVIRMVYGFY